MENFENEVNAVAQWIVDYRKNLPEIPVQPKSPFGVVLEKLPLSAPEKGDGLKNLLASFEGDLLPHMMHWQHPRFFGYFPAQASEASLLAEMIVAAMGSQCMSWITSPAATELEIRMMEWTREALGLSREFTGSIQDSASNATLAAMVAARERATDFRSNEEGLGSFPLVAYVSEEAHSSVEKAAKVIGLGRQHLKKIPVNADLGMNTQVLEETIQKDIEKGLQPFFVVGAFGTTGTTAIDNLSEISRIAKLYKLWHHVDAAFAGALLLLPEERWRAKGVDEADSLVFNPHKWMRTHFDCSTLFVKDTKSFVRSFEILPEYLKTGEETEVVNFRDWGLGLGRRFRALKLFFVFKAYGLEGLRDKIRQDLRHAEQLEEKISQNSAFELLAPRSMNLLCFGLKNGRSEELMSRLNSTGKVFFSHTKVQGRYAIRWVFGQLSTTHQDIDLTWKLIEDHSADLV